AGWSRRRTRSPTGTSSRRASRAASRSNRLRYGASEVLIVLARLGGLGKDPMRLALPRAVPLLAVIAAFFGLATVAHAQPGSVAVFNNPDYIDNQDTDFGAEGPNTVASLQSFGETVTQFTDVSAAGFTAAVAGKDSLVI